MGVHLYVRAGKCACWWVFACVRVCVRAWKCVCESVLRVSASRSAYISLSLAYQ